MGESAIRGVRNRILQILARSAPGASSFRVKCHRGRGVHIGSNVWIGYDAIIETSHPEFVTIGSGAVIGIRCTIIAHFRETKGVVIEEDVMLGPGVMVLPGVTIGRGSVVTAGSVVTVSVPPMTVVQGNPAKPIAKTGIPFRKNVSVKEFSKHLVPIK